MGHVVEQMENFAREVETLKYKHMGSVELEKTTTQCVKLKKKCLAVMD